MVVATVWMLFGYTVVETPPRRPLHPEHHCLTQVHQMDRLSAKGGDDTKKCVKHWDELVRTHGAASAMMDAVIDDALLTREEPLTRDAATLREAHDIIEPEWVCESEFRLGNNSKGEAAAFSMGDGPKFVCGADLLATMPDCLVYSIGSNWQWDFEWVAEALF